VRAQVTIEHVFLAQPARMKVTFLDGNDTTVQQMFVDQEDAEYQLLAGAIDRFVKMRGSKVDKP
jgi:hypothetical protein